MAKCGDQQKVAGRTGRGLQNVAARGILADGRVAVIAGTETTTTRARLQLISGNGSGRVFELTQERVNIGRDDANIISIRDDTISSHHALLVRIGGHFKLRDLISTNGTYLNGERTMDAMLRHGDLLRFGEVEMRYEEIQSPAGPPPPAESPLTVLPLGRSRSIPVRPAGDRPFRIIGADGRTYGPVNSETLKLWIAQGFANGHTWMPAESRGNWKQLQNLPEFTDALVANDLPTNMLGTPPQEMLCDEPIKVGPGAGPDALVAGREPVLAVKPLGAPRRKRRRTASVLVGVAMLAVAGGAAAAWRYDQWPFDMRGPFRHYAHGAAGFIYVDPEFTAAESAEDSKDFAGFLKDAKELVADYPDNSLAHYILGVAYGKMNFFGDAATCFQDAIKLKPDYVDAWNNLGWAYSKMGRFTDAAPVFEQLVKFTPKDAQAWSNLGGARAGQGHEKEAIVAYLMAIQLRPDYADAHFNLGVAYAGAGKFDEAVSCFRQALKYQPNFPEAWFNLGVVSTRQGSNDEAAVYFQQAVKFRPDYAEAWGGLVKTYLAMHESEKAGEAAREMKRLDPAKAEQLADELSREEPKLLTEAAPAEAPQADPPQGDAGTQPPPPVPPGLR